MSSECHSNVISNELLSSSSITSSSNPSKETSRTTTIPQISTSHSTNSSSENSIRNLRSQLNLMRIQLDQREKELQKCELIHQTEDVYSKRWMKENESQMRRINVLEGICSQLLNCLEENEVVERQKLDSIASMYKKHIECLVKESKTLKKHNSVLEQKLENTSAKLLSLDNENKLIRWDNNRYKEEMEVLKSRINEQQNHSIQLKKELNLIKNTNDHLRLTQSARLNDEVGSAVSKKVVESESLRRQLKDREKEYGINLTRMYNEIGFLKKELERKENLCKKFTQMLDKLTDDNHSLFDEISSTRLTHEQHVEKLNNAILRTEKDGTDAKDSNRSCQAFIGEHQKTCQESQTLGSDVQRKLLRCLRDEELDKANGTIECLRQQVEKLSAIQKISAPDELTRNLKQEAIRVSELEGEIRHLKSELQNEKEQRKNATILLIEMGRDMRYLIDSARDRS